MCNCREKRHWEKTNALIADREEGANSQYNRMRLMELGLHTIESQGTHDHRKSIEQSSLVPSGYGCSLFSAKPISSPPLRKNHHPRDHRD